MRFRKHFIGKDTSVRDAMGTIDKVNPQIAFIVEENKLIASLTDGDIRRYLLKGGKMTDYAIEAANKSPKTATDAQHAAEIYHNRNYIAIPIVTDKMDIIDLYIGKRNSNERAAELNIPVVINAGGKGTRLEPYTKILPKPLIPVGELPIIEHIILRFKNYGCEQFSMIVNYKKALMKAFFADSEKKYDVTWYDEENPLGTGGGLCYLKGKISGTFFFTSCDTLILSNYESMIRFHRENKNVITMICAYKDVKIPYGIIEMGENGSILNIQEKPEYSFLTNTGMYIVEPEVLDDIEYGVSIGFPDIVETQRKKGKKVAIYPISGNDWLDMGQLSELEKMRIRLYGV